MVVGGVDPDHELRQNLTDDFYTNEQYRRKDVRLISLDAERHPVPECLEDLSNYPMGITGAVGAALDNGE